MQTITLKLEDNITEKFMWLLSHFNQNEVAILDKAKYKSDDEYLKSIKGMEQSILKASKEPIQNYVSRDELEW